MNCDVLCFFDKSPLAIPLYEEFEQRVLSEIDGVSIRVQKTQIAFSNKHNFAFVSFLPVRKAKERPNSYIQSHIPTVGPILSLYQIWRK